VGLFDYLTPKELVLFCLIGLIVLGSLSNEIRKWTEAGQ
jgi:hypothetical protein